MTTRPADPPYTRIVTEIRRRIDAGELRPGDRVPSTRQITIEWGVAMATATKALTALRQEGLVRAVPGTGTVVADTAPPAMPVARPPREPREVDLTRELISRTAVAVADRDGLTGLSMRRVAGELGVATMSLYRHVRNKDDLITLMIDAVFVDEPPPRAAPAGWRAHLEAVARLQWSIYRRRPWLAQVMLFTRPPLAPNAMAHTEWTMRALDGLGLPTTTMFLAAVTLANYVRGTAVNLESEAEARQDTGLTDDQWMQTQEEDFGAVLETGRFPMLFQAVAEPGFEFDLDQLFEFGLQRMLDGLAPLVDR